MRVEPERQASAVRCRVIMSGDKCTENAAYRVTFDDCAACRDFYGWLLCGGHSVCVQHTADVRTNGYDFTVPGDICAAVPIRVHGAT